MNGITKPEKLYKEMYIDSSELLIPRELYQRTLNHARVREIAENFDERVANEPKVSARDGGFLFSMGSTPQRPGYYRTTVRTCQFSARSTRA